jgi:hypothetical protein
VKRIYISILVLFCSLSAFAQVEWKEIKSDNSKISFKLPEDPSIQKKKLAEIDIEVFSYRDDLNVYGIVASDFSKTGLDFTYTDPTEYYEEMKEGSLVTGDALLISEKSVSYKKMLGKEIVYTQMVGRHEYTYYKRFFFRGKFIYQIAIGGPSSAKKILFDKKKYFFNTLEFYN